MDIADLLHNWRRALGYVTVGSVYQRMTLETGGLSGTYEIWQQPSGERKEAFNLGDIYSELRVYDGERGWIKDQNGLVRELADSELEAERTQAYLGSFSHLIAERLPGEAVYSGEEEGAHALELRPQGGRPVKVYLASDTFLPVKQEEVVHDRTETTTFSDWREVEGVMFAFASRQSTGDAKYDVLFRVEEVRLSEPLSDDLFVKPSADAAPLFEDPQVTLPFELISNHIHVEGHIGDSRPLSIIVDTGAGGSVLSSSLARDLGLEEVGKLEVRGGGEGSQDLGHVKGVNLKLGGHMVQEATFATIDLTPLEPLEGRTIDLILGYDVLGRTVLEVDYAARQITFHSPEIFVYEGSGERIPFTLQNNHPHIHADVLLREDKYASGTFLVDTGAHMALYLNRLFTERHSVKSAVPKVLELPERVSGVGGASRESVARLPGVRLGAYEFTEIVTTLSESTSGSLETEALAGLIGGDLLKRFRVFFDYGAQEMILEPNTEFDAPFAYDASGLRLVAENLERVTVQAVLANSPAERAGLRAGDGLEAVEVDSVPAEHYTLNDIRERLMEAGTLKTLSLRRNGETFEVELRLEALI